MWVRTTKIDACGSRRTKGNSCRLDRLRSILVDPNDSDRHLFFTCPVARVVWRTVGCVLGTDTCPNNIWQYFSWCYVFLPDGESFTHLCLQPCAGLYGIAETKLPLNKKKLKTPFAVIYSACGFISYWAGMMKEEDRAMMEWGSKMLKASTAAMMRICAAAAEPAMD